MTDIKDSGSIRTSRDRDVEKEQKRKDLFLSANETIDRLLQKITQSLEIGKLREKTLLSNISQNQKISMVVSGAFKEGKVGTPIRQMDESDILTTDSRSQKSRIVSSKDDIFENSHIPEEQRCVADSFFQVFSVLVWDLLKTYRPKKFQQIIAGIQKFNFEKYKVIKNLTLGLGIDNKNFNQKIKELTRQLHEKSSLKLCQQEPYLQELLNCLVKYMLCQKLAEENNLSQIQKLESADKRWAEVQELVQTLIESVFSLELRKSEEEQYCLMDQDAKMVIVRVKAYDYFQGHIERLSKLSPFRKNK